MKTEYLMPGVKKVVFDNGLTLAMEMIPNYPLASLVLALKVGSACEEINGISHLTEHLIFTGDAKLSEKGLKQIMKKQRARIEAATHQFATIYSVLLLPDFIPQNIELLYRVIKNRDYKISILKKEREEVLEELGNEMNNPLDYCLHRLFYPRLFKGSSFEKTILGTLESLQLISACHIKAFKREKYVPNNMFLSAVGGFQEEKLIQSLQKTFARLKAGVEIRLPYDDNLLVNRREDYFENRLGLGQVFLVMGYKIPNSIENSDLFTLKLISDILFARFKEASLTYSISVDLPNFGLARVFLIALHGFDPQKYQDIMDYVLGELECLKTELVDPEELETEKDAIEFLHIVEMMEPRWRAIRLAEKMLFNYPYDYREWVRHIQAITPQDILSVARKYFTDDYTLAALAPRGFRP